MHNQSLPADLISFIGTENIDFAVIAKRNQPVKKSLAMIAFGAVWTAFTSIFVFAILVPVLNGEVVHFKANGVRITASLNNFQPLVLPTITIGFFVAIGIAMLLSGLKSFFKKGGYFVGTANRLIHYQNGNIKVYDWEQFSGNMEINYRKGDIALQLRTGKMESRKDRSDVFVPDIIDISGAEDILEITEICKTRIKENDPTPAKALDE